MFTNKILRKIDLKVGGDYNQLYYLCQYFLLFGLTALTSMVMSGLDSTVLYIIKRTFYKKISFEKSFVKRSFMFWDN